MNEYFLVMNSKKYIYSFIDLFLYRTRTFFYKNIEAKIGLKFKNVSRSYPG